MEAYRFDTLRVRCLSSRLSLCRSKFQGNPRLYNFFIDEALNRVLRSVGEHAHRVNLEYRIFQLFNLQGLLDVCEFFFGYDPSTRP